MGWERALDRECRGGQEGTLPLLTLPCRSDIAKQWCQLNKITAILRSHEVRNDGYQEEHDVSWPFRSCLLTCSR